MAAINWQAVDFRRIRDLRRWSDIRRRELWRETLLMQYSNSRRMIRLLHGWERLIDPHWDILDFYQKVFDPRTAEGWGLDCWGRIVAIDRTLQMYSTYECFGFKYSECTPFNCAPFDSGEMKVTTHRLSDDLYRKLIFFKAAINITDGTLATLNKLLNDMYGDQGTVQVLHVGTMKIRFLFDFELSQEERYLIQQEEVPPKPAGVGYELYEIEQAATFGFDGSGLQPFNQGTFANRRPVNAYSISS